MAEQCARKSNENSLIEMLHQLVMISNQLENLVQVSKWEMMKMKNAWKQKFPE